MFLAQHDILLAAPALIQLAETGVAIAIRVGLPVLLPEQLLGHVSMHAAAAGECRRSPASVHGRASPWRTAEQGRFQPVFVPILRKRPRHSRSFGPLQILVNGPETNRTTAGDLPLPQTHSKLQSKNFFDLPHGQSPGWQAILPFQGGSCHCVVQRRWLNGNYSGLKPNAIPGSA